MNLWCTTPEMLTLCHTKLFKLHFVTSGSHVTPSQMPLVAAPDMPPSMWCIIPLHWHERKTTFTDTQLKSENIEDSGVLEGGRWHGCLCFHGMYWFTNKTCTVLENKELYWKYNLQEMQLKQKNTTSNSYTEKIPQKKQKKWTVSKETEINRLTLEFEPIHQR